MLNIRNELSLDYSSGTWCCIFLLLNSHFTQWHYKLRVSHGFLPCCHKVFIVKGDIATAHLSQSMLTCKQTSCDFHKCFIGQHLKILEFTMLAAIGSMIDLMFKQQFHFLRILIYSVKVYCSLSKPISQSSSH